MLNRIWVIRTNLKFLQKAIEIFLILPDFKQGQMQDLRITTIQADIFWEDYRKNLDHFGQLLRQISEPTDLILLPEMFSTGFSSNPTACSETMEGPSVEFLRAAAKKKKVHIMATLIIAEGRGFYNRLICACPDGDLITCDKRHLFRLSGEYELFRNGKKKIIVEIRGWKILPLVCYDLRFPVWSKNTWSDGQYGYDLLVYLANWPAIRSHVWKTLLMARALENQVYVAGVNRFGNDGYGTWHEGDTRVVDPKGNLLYAAQEAREEIKTVTLSATDLKLFRDSFTLGMDWDRFKINTR